MERASRSIQVQVPISTVYNQWTQFEEFPSFMQDIQEVRQIDDTHLHWRARIAGKDLEWDAEIIDQVPDQRVSWRSIAGKTNNGTISFEPAEGGTRVTVTMEYDPEGFWENLGEAVGVPERRIENDLKRFKKFIEQRGSETGAWRGEVHDGQKARPDNQTTQPRSPANDPLGRR